MAMSRRSFMSARSAIQTDIRCTNSSFHHNSEYCYECRKIAELEAKQSLNANKLRFRFVRENRWEDVKYVVHEILNRALHVKLDDIGDCTRVYPWESEHHPYWPWDIQVVFRNQRVRDFVYDYKSWIEIKNRGLRIVEELVPERGLIWKHAVLFFGYERVCTINGVINVSTYSLQNLCVYTVRQMTDLIAKERRFIENKIRRAERAMSARQ